MIKRLTTSDLEDAVGKIIKEKKETKKDPETEEVKSKIEVLRGDTYRIERYIRDIRTREHRALSITEQLESRMFWVFLTFEGGWLIDGVGYGADACGDDCDGCCASFCDSNLLYQGWHH